MDNQELIRRIWKLVNESFIRKHSESQTPEGRRFEDAKMQAYGEVIDILFGDITSTDRAPELPDLDNGDSDDAWQDHVNFLEAGERNGR